MEVAFERGGENYAMTKMAMNVTMERLGRRILVLYANVGYAVTRLLCWR